MFLSFSTDLRQLYYQAGVENKPTVFLFNDTQVVEESFLEDINNILSSGEVPNLYKPEEFEEVRVLCVHVCSTKCGWIISDCLFQSFLYFMLGEASLERSS